MNNISAARAARTKKAQANPELETRRRATLARLQALQKQAQTQQIKLNALKKLALARRIKQLQRKNITPRTLAQAEKAEPRLAKAAKPISRPTPKPGALRTAAKPPQTTRSRTINPVAKPAPTATRPATKPTIPIAIKPRHPPTRLTRFLRKAKPPQLPTRTTPSAARPPLLRMGRVPLRLNTRAELTLVPGRAQEKTAKREAAETAKKIRERQKAEKALDNLLAKAEVELKPEYKQALATKKVIDFIQQLKKDAAKAYFNAIAQHGTEKLTTPELMDFAKQLGPNAAGAYFDAIREHGTKKLVTKEVMDFAQQLGKNTWMYFYAIARQGTEKLASKEFLTPEVAKFAQQLPEDAAGAYFNAIAQHGPEKLTSKEFMDFAKQLPPDTAWHYFDAIVVHGPEKLASKEFMTHEVAKFTQQLPTNTARQYFKAIAQHGTKKLASKEVMDLAFRAVKPKAMEAFFNAVGHEESLSEIEPLLKRIHEARSENSISEEEAQTHILHAIATAGLADILKINHALGTNIDTLISTAQLITKSKLKDNPDFRNFLAHGMRKRNFVTSTPNLIREINRIHELNHTQGLIEKIAEEAHLAQTLNKHAEAKKLLNQINQIRKKLTPADLKAEESTLQEKIAKIEEQLAVEQTIQNLKALIPKTETKQRETFNQTIEKSKTRQDLKNALKKYTERTQTPEKTKRDMKIGR